MAHAKRSPSSSDRWMACAGSINAEEGIPNISSVYAEEGTRAHEILEMCLRLACEPDDIASPNDPPDMVGAVAHAVDFLRGYLANHPAAEWHPEQILMVDEANDIWGTSDLIVVDPDELVVADYKHGYGVVDVEGNSQLLTYAVGARRKYGHRPRYRLAVIQPRARHEDGPVRETLVTDAELTAFATRQRAAAIATQDPNAPRTAGVHCKWCRARGTCPELAEAALRAALKDFSSLSDGVPPAPSPAPVQVDNETLGQLMGVAPVVELWLGALRETVKDRIMMGQHIPGFKLVGGRRLRNWADPAEAEQVLLASGFPADMIAPRSLVGPAGVDRAVKALKKAGVVIAPDLYADLIVWKESAPTVAPESDPRPAISLGSEFSEMTDKPEV